MKTQTRFISFTNRSRNAAVSSIAHASVGVAMLLGFCFTNLRSTMAHHPNKECQPVTPRHDLIGPIGNRLEPDHRRKYNRPSYWMGKIAYKIAPSSQEAMAWHRAVHSGAYESPKECMRLEKHFFYPKPWQLLNVGPRRSVLESPNSDHLQSVGIDLRDENNSVELIPQELDGPNDMVISDESLPAPVTEELELPDVKVAPIDDATPIEKPTEPQSIAPQPPALTAPQLKTPDLNSPDLGRLETKDASVPEKHMARNEMAGPISQVTATVPAKAAQHAAFKKSERVTTPAVSRTGVSRSKPELRKAETPAWFSRLQHSS